MIEPRNNTHPTWRQNTFLPPPPMDYTDYPQIDPTFIKESITGQHWELDENWLLLAGITDIPGHYIDADDPESPPIWINDLWEYILSLFDVFPEPIFLSLHFNSRTLTTSKPLLQLLPRMTGLTALYLVYEIQEEEEEEEDDDDVTSPDYNRNVLMKGLLRYSPSELNKMKEVALGLLNGNGGDLTPEMAVLYRALQDESLKDELLSHKTVLSMWLEAFSPSQLNQLQHFTLQFHDGEVWSADLSEWLKQMPHLQSLGLTLMYPDWETPLHIPTLTELKQLSIFCPIAAEDLDIPVLPSLTRLSVNVCYPETASSWLPNLQR